MKKIVLFIALLMTAGTLFAQESALIGDNPIIQTDIMSWIYYIETGHVTDDDAILIKKVSKEKAQKVYTMLQKHMDVWNLSQLAQLGTDLKVASYIGEGHDLKKLNLGYSAGQLDSLVIFARSTINGIYGGVETAKVDSQFMVANNVPYVSTDDQALMVFALINREIKKK